MQMRLQSKLSLFLASLLLIAIVGISWAALGQLRALAFERDRRVALGILEDAGTRFTALRREAETRLRLLASDPNIQESLRTLDRQRQTRLMETVLPRLFERFQDTPPAVDEIRLILSNGTGVKTVVGTEAGTGVEAEAARRSAAPLEPDAARQVQRIDQLQSWSVLAPGEFGVEVVGSADEGGLALLVVHRIDAGSRGEGLPDSAISRDGFLRLSLSLSRFLEGLQGRNASGPGRLMMIDRSGREWLPRVDQPRIWSFARLLDQGAEDTLLRATRLPDDREGSYWGLSLAPELKVVVWLPRSALTAEFRRLAGWGGLMFAGMFVILSIGLARILRGDGGLPTVQRPDVLSTQGALDHSSRLEQDAPIHEPAESVGRVVGLGVIERDQAHCQEPLTDEVARQPGVMESLSPPESQASNREAGSSADESGESRGKIGDGAHVRGQGGSPTRGERPSLIHPVRASIQLSGVSMAHGCAVAGSKVQLLRLLGELVASHRLDPMRMREHEAAGQRHAIRELAHTLWLAAETLGAYEIADVAAMLAEQSDQNEGSSFPRFIGMISRLERSLAKLEAELAGVAAGGRPSGERHGKEAADRDAAVLQEVISLLELADTQAMRLIRSHSDLFEGVLNQRYGAFIVHLERFDLDGALEMLKDAQSTGGISSVR